MEDVLERHYAVREMVKDLSLKTKVIAEKTGYNQSYVSELRRRHLNAEARKAERLKRQEEEQRKEQARIDRLIAKAVAKEREACARLCDIAVENFTSISLQVGDDDGIVMEHANTCNHLATAIRARGQA